MAATEAKTRRIPAKRNGRMACQLPSNLLLHFLVALTCSSLCSYHGCRFSSHLGYFVEQCSFLLSHASLVSSFLTPKCLFIVANVIIAFLVGESKLIGSRSSSPAGEIYDEYMDKSRHLLRERKPIFDDDPQPIKEPLHSIALFMVAEPAKLKQEDDPPPFLIPSRCENQRDHHLREEDEDEEEDTGLPTEELNRRVEEFIARVNKQRWLEAKSLMDGSSSSSPTHHCPSMAANLMN